MTKNSENNIKFMCIIPAAGESSRFKKGNKLFEYIYESGTTSSGVTLTDGSYSGAISGVKLEDLQAYSVN